MDYLASGKKQTQSINNRYIGKSKHIKSYRSVRSRTVKDAPIHAESEDVVEKRFNEIPNPKTKLSQKGKDYKWKNRTMDEGNKVVREIIPKVNFAPKSVVSTHSIKSEALKSEIVSMLETMDEKELENLRKTLIDKAKFNKKDDRASLTEKNLKDLEENQVKREETKDVIRSHKQSIHSIKAESQ